MDDNITVLQVEQQSAAHFKELFRVTTSRDTQRKKNFNTNTEKVGNIYYYYYYLSIRSLSNLNHVHLC